jgi:tRNA-2-methylthio-N6-dimethylallyladenosine synthase
MPEDRAFGQIHNLRKNNPKVKIALTGCISQRKDVQKVLTKKVDLFFPINDFSLFENFIIENFLEIGNWKLEISEQKKIISNIKDLDYLHIKPKYENSHQALVPIMTGCNNFCTYCVVPYARGREISRPADEIIKEIKTLIKKGYKEINLLGQNVNSYTGELKIKPCLPAGRNKKLKVFNFADLLKEINKIPGDFWIRFLSSHPKDMNDELIETVTKLEKVCELIHLPIQSGDNKLLENMNRRYTQEHYLNLIKKIKKSFKQNKPTTSYAISSDIIVGFPGETKTQLEKSAFVMSQVKYDMVYFGQFSPRPQTAAWKMEDNVSKIEKERREKYLNEILKKTALFNNKKYLNKIVDVLIDKMRTESPLGDSVPKDKEYIYFGKTRTFKNVLIKSNKENLVGKFVKVKITKATTWNLEGEIYEQ